MKKILILLFAVLLLAGCSKQKNPSVPPLSPDSNATIDPEWEWLYADPTGPEATKAILELSEQSLTESLAYYFLANGNQDGRAYLDSIAQARSFSVTSFTQTDKVVTAKVSVCVPDVCSIVNSMDLSAYATAEEMDAALCSAIQAATPQTKEASVVFTAGNNRWEPIMDEASADIFYGGLMTYLQESLEGVA